MSTIVRPSKENGDAQLLELSKTVENQLCADCGNKGTRWASYTLGVFLCIRCGGLHRRIGTHISRIKSITLDSWTTEQVEFMRSWGNIRANAHYMPRPDFFCIPEDSEGDMEQFIREKYEKKLFMDPVRCKSKFKVKNPPPESLTAKPVQSISSNSQIERTVPNRSVESKGNEMSLSAKGTSSDPSFAFQGNSIPIVNQTAVTSDFFTDQLAQPSPVVPINNGAAKTHDSNSGNTALSDLSAVFSNDSATRVNNAKANILALYQQQSTNPNPFAQPSIPSLQQAPFGLNNNQHYMGPPSFYNASQAGFNSAWSSETNTSVPLNMSTGFPPMQMAAAQHHNPFLMQQPSQNSRKDPWIASQQNR